MTDRIDKMVRCPTCRAVQEWSDTCRRCKSDLALLRHVASAYGRHRRHCLQAIDAGRPTEALRSARHCHWLRPGPDARRLLALASLVAGDWTAAAAFASGDPGAGPA